MNEVYVHTLGDSTLDNLYWMLDCRNNVVDAKKHSVEGQLQTRLNTDSGTVYKVVSAAYDGFTTKSVLYGDVVGDVLPYGQGAKKIYLQEKSSGRVHPLEQLKGRIQAAPDSIHYVVISVGGNDFRENLLNPIRLIREIPNIQKRYIDIVERVKALGGANIRPILMLQYRTDAKYDPYRIYTIMKVIGTAAATIHSVSLAAIASGIALSATGALSATVGGLLSLSGLGGIYLGRKIAPVSIITDMLFSKNGGVAMLGALMERFYKPILAYAKKEKIPVLDLPHTFDPYQKLYESGIEPNKAGGTLISMGLHHIITQHDFTSESKLYAKQSADRVYTASVLR